MFHIFAMCCNIIIGITQASFVACVLRLANFFCGYDAGRLCLVECNDVLFVRMRRSD